MFFVHTYHIFDKKLTKTFLTESFTCLKQFIKVLIKIEQNLGHHFYLVFKNPQCNGYNKPIAPHYSFVLQGCRVV